MLDFNCHSRRTGWNKSALSRHFYKGLPDRLKDEIARIGKPARLTELQSLVATLDQRYWERQSEISRDKRAAAPPKPAEPRSNNQQSSSSSSSSSKPNPPAQQSKGKDQKKAASPAESSSSNNKPAAKANSIADVLGPDGKLKPEERQRRLDNKLCLRCGKTGHVASDCNPSKPKPKGRAAVATATSPAAPPASGKA